MSRCRSLPARSLEEQGAVWSEELQARAGRRVDIGEHGAEAGDAGRTATLPGTLKRTSITLVLSAMKSRGGLNGANSPL